MDRPPAWMASASCAQTDPELWFPPTGGGWQITAAIAICRSCPVLAECTAWEAALEEPLTHGIVAGRGARTRQDERVARRARGAAS